MPTLIRGDEVYSIEQKGSELVVRSGKTGAVKERVRRFVAADKAAIALKRAVANKVEEGYTISDANVTVTKSEPKLPARELAIIDNPDDAQAWAIFGDWLSENGDPRGKLIALERSGGAAADINRLVAEHEYDWFGAELWERREDLTCEFKGGFLADVKMRFQFEADPVDFLPELLKLPAARFMTSLSIFANIDGVHGDRYEPGGIQVSELDPFTDAFKKAPALALRRFVYSVSAFAPVDHAARMIHHAPRLRELTLHGTGMNFRQLAHETLESLTLVTPSIGKRLAQQLATMRLPALQSLSLTVRPQYDITIRSLNGALTSSTLQSLTLRGAENMAELMLELARSKLLPRLTSLRLLDGHFIDSDIDGLLENAERFSHLKTLDLSGATLSADDAQRMQAAFPAMVLRPNEPLEDTVFYDPTME